MILACVVLVYTHQLLTIYTCSAESANAAKHAPTPSADKLRYSQGSQTICDIARLKINFPAIACNNNNNANLLHASV